MILIRTDLKVPLKVIRFGQHMMMMVGITQLNKELFQCHIHSDQILTEDPL